jgi:hypothetical protein
MKQLYRLQLAPTSMTQIGLQVALHISDFRVVWL